MDNADDGQDAASAELPLYDYERQRTLDKVSKRQVLSARTITLRRR